MKQASLLLLVLISTLLPVRAFFLFQTIIEINHDVSNPNATLAMLAGKKYRIKFYNISCPDCKTILKPDSGLKDSISVRTKLKGVGSNSRATHHVITVGKIKEATQGKIYLEAIHGIYSRTIKVDINTEEACKLQ